MKFTSEDLMKTMGLKVGDRVAFKYGVDKVIFKINENELEYENGKLPLFNLLNRDIEILPAPKRVGDFKCKECDCGNCPIRAICINDSLGSEQDTLFETLEAYKKKDYLDQEIYDILKARLDKEVEE